MKSALILFFIFSVTAYAQNTPIQPGVSAISAADNKTKSSQVAQSETAKLESQRQDTLQWKAQFPLWLQVQIPVDSVIVSRNISQLTVLDPATHSGSVIDVATGMTLYAFGPNTGLAMAPPVDAKPDAVGNVSASDYTRMVVRNSGSGLMTFEKTFTRGSLVEITFDGKNNFQVRDTLMLKDDSGVFKPHIIVQDRRFANVYVPMDGTNFLLPVYHPFWWGTPYDMAGAWIADLDGGRYPVYARFFSPSSPWWGAGNFISWKVPYNCSYSQFSADDCWHQRYRSWGWTWDSDPFYKGYYAPKVSNSSIGEFLVDYRFQLEMENERLMRLAEVEDSNFDSGTNDLALGGVTNELNVPMSRPMWDQMVSQARDIVSAINIGKVLTAPFLIGCYGAASNIVPCSNHLFTVDTVYRETAVSANGRTYECRLNAGDLIQRDPGHEIQTQQAYNPDGTPEIDGDGNPVRIAYVPMLVKASKQQGCAVNQTVAVQMTSLQNMLSEEVARTQEGMERAVELGIKPSSGP